MISMMVNNAFLAGFSIGDIHRGTLHIFYLLFVDDTQIFCEADLNQIQALRALLLCSEAMSGLKVNLSKLELVPVGNICNIWLLANTLSCKVSSLHMNYLGLPF